MTVVTALTGSVDVLGSLGVLGPFHHSGFVEIRGYDCAFERSARYARSPFELVKVSVGGAPALRIDDEIPVIFDEFES